MDCREFCHIFFIRRTLFLGVMTGSLLLALFVFRFQPSRYETDLLLNVARSGMRETDEYTYDQFYRLQADERFADTVVRWAEEPSVREAIRERAGAGDGVVDSLSAKRLSSQVVHVRYSARDSSDFGRMAEAVPATFNESSARINELSRNPDWFMLVADRPVMRDARLSFGFLLGLGTMLGAFAGFWTVLAAWYFGVGTEGPPSGGKG